VVVCVPGMRRLSYVEVFDEGGAVRFYAVGTGHRRPVTVPISRALAAQLAGRVRFVERRGPAAVVEPAVKTLQSID
jgi:hypothetical protein